MTSDTDPLVVAPVSPGDEKVPLVIGRARRIVQSDGDNCPCSIGPHRFSEAT